MWSVIVSSFPRPCGADRDRYPRSRPIRDPSPRAVADVAHATVWDERAGYLLGTPDERTPVHHISKVTDVITLPARTAFAVANVGVRTTVRLVGWAVEQAFGQATGRGPGTSPRRPTVTPVPSRVPPSSTSTRWSPPGPRRPRCEEGRRHEGADEEGPGEPGPAEVGAHAVDDPPASRRSMRREVSEPAAAAPAPATKAPRRRRPPRRLQRRRPLRRRRQQRRRRPSRPPSWLPPSGSARPRSPEVLGSTPHRRIGAAETETLRAASDPDRG